MRGYPGKKRGRAERSWTYQQQQKIPITRAVFI